MISRNSLYLPTGLKMADVDTIMHQGGYRQECNIVFFQYLQQNIFYWFTQINFAIY